MIYYDKIKVIGSDSSGRSIAVVSLWVDSAANLPAANAYQSDGFILGMGSEGNCIDSGDKYRLDSSGAWQITQAGTGTYTKAEIDAIVSRIDATEADDRAALVQLVDSGEKNRLLFDGIGTKSGNAGNIDFTYNQDGSITVNGSVDDSGNAYVNLQLNSTSINAHGTPDFCNGDFVLSGCPVNSSGLSLRATGTGYTASVDTGSGADINTAESGVVVRLAVFVAKGNTVSNLNVRPMISTKTAWKISTQYQPYRPSWQKMYDMILALQ